ncbi:crAss001_48 related protein [Limosilactobacillus reuteri]|uniref:crAss001_48 related protein n=1 Tax=Limosilactobacillus reuteri TaxID=1598 RepID=UPI000A1DC72A|nr:hypothetical protein [Limosilactobacillus reuteri]
MINKIIDTENLNLELFELETKIEKLQKFIDCDDFLSISTINQMLLANQMVGMAMYRDSLHKRIKLAEGDSEYTVQVLPNDDGFLNKDIGDGVYFLYDNEGDGKYQTHFTQSEIDEMKDNPFFAAINWDNVKIEPVEDDD